MKKNTKKKTPSSYLCSCYIWPGVDSNSFPLTWWCHEWLISSWYDYGSNRFLLNWLCQSFPFNLVMIAVVSIRHDDSSGFIPSGMVTAEVVSFFFIWWCQQCFLSDLMMVTLICFSLDDGNSDFLPSVLLMTAVVSI